MIARIVTGRGNNRRTHDLPVSLDRKQHVSERITMGNILKSNYLFPNGKGFKQAKARGLAAVGAA